MAEKLNLKNIKTGSPKMDLIISKLDQVREDHRRQAATMDSLSNQVSRLQSLLARVKGESRAIIPTTEVVMKIEDKIAAAEGKMTTLEGLVYAIHNATNKTQDDVKLIMAALKIPVSGSDEDGEDEGDEYKLMPTGAPQGGEDGDGGAEQESEDGRVDAEERKESGEGQLAELDHLAAAVDEVRVESADERPAEALAALNAEVARERTTAGTRGRDTPQEVQDRATAAHCVF